MKKQISKNYYYELEVDLAKNRLYLTYRNFWRSTEVAPNYLAELEEALKEVKPGFTTLQDNSGHSIAPKEVAQQIISRAETLLHSACPTHTAVVLPEDSIARKVAQISLRLEQEIHQAKAPHFFASREQAEQWLDAISVQQP